MHFNCGISMLLRTISSNAQYVKVSTESVEIMWPSGEYRRILARERVVEIPRWNAVYKLFRKVNKNNVNGKKVNNIEDLLL